MAIGGGPSVPRYMFYNRQDAACHKPCGRSARKSSHFHRRVAVGPVANHRVGTRDWNVGNR